MRAPAEAPPRRSRARDWLTSLVLLWQNAAGVGLRVAIVNRNGEVYGCRVNRFCSNRSSSAH